MKKVSFRLPSGKLPQTRLSLACIMAVLFGWYDAVYGASQDTIAPVRNRVTLYTNIGLNLITEYNANLDWRFNHRTSVGVGGGRVVENRLFDPRSPNEEKYPNEYRGYAARANVKFYRTDTVGNDTYWCAQLLVKQLAYYQKAFVLDDVITFKRSEEAVVVGLSVLRGMRWHFIDDRLSCDLFYGAGVRGRIRRYTTFNADYIDVTDRPLPPIGDFKRVVIGPSLHLGFNLGLNIVR